MGCVSHLVEVSPNVCWEKGSTKALGVGERNESFPKSSTRHKETLHEQNRNGATGNGGLGEEAGAEDQRRSWAKKGRGRGGSWHWVWRLR